VQPYKLIKGGMFVARRAIVAAAHLDCRHHSDEYGAPIDVAEPAEIARVHGEEVDFVLAWLDEFRSR
jgi:hypothetical protein